MAHSLGDGIRSFNESVERDRAKAQDWLETIGWRDPEIRQRIMTAVPYIMAAEALAMEPHGFSPDREIANRAEMLRGMAHLELDKLREPK